MKDNGPVRNGAGGRDAGEPPPFLGTWGRVYAAVLAFLGALIALFWLFQRGFTP